jgi:hypothetical protein
MSVMDGAIGVAGGQRLDLPGSVGLALRGRPPGGSLSAPRQGLQLLRGLLPQARMVAGAA